VTVSGETIRTVLDGLDALPPDGVDETRTIFEANGFRDVDPDKWYPRAAWLAALREVAATVGSDALRSLGQHVPKTTVWPPDVTTVPDAIASINDAYHMNHRGSELGAYTFRQTGDHRGRVTSTTPYPCPFDVGIVEGVIREFSPTVTTTALAFVHEVSDTCRADGGEQCTYAVRW
jgi:hypothetical protein